MAELSDDVTAILRNWQEEAQSQQSDLLFAVLYDDLRQIAHNLIRDERAGHTLSGTALVHEVFIRLINSQACTWDNRKHFFNVAARSMRRTLVDHARSKNSQKRGGEHRRNHDVLLTELSQLSADPQVTIELNEALDALEVHCPELARIVELRFFCNLTHIQIADLLEMTEVTVRRRWAFARAWLSQRLQTEPTDGYTE